MFRTVVAAALLFALSVPVFAQTLQLVFFVARTPGPVSSCKVVEGELKSGDGALAGPFDTRDEAVRAMKKIHECQSRN